MPDQKEHEKNRRAVPAPELPEQVEQKAARRLKGQRGRRHGVWFGMGMFGMIGWTIAISTVLGIALGVWIDRTWPSPYSWTLMLLVAGIIVGCLNAWYWIKREIQDNDEDR